MSLLTKILVAVGVIVALCATSLIIYKQFEISERQKAIETEVVKQKELSDNITRSLNEYATKRDIEQFVKDNNMSLKTIQNDMNKLHAEIKSINVITVSSGGSSQSGISSTGTGPKNPNPPQTPQCNGNEPCPNIDTYGYFKERQNLALYEPFGNVKVPIGSIGFSAWELGPWTTDIKPRTYSVTSVVGVDENQRQYFYNKFTIKVDGKNYDLRIDNATTKQEYPEASFRFWNPRLFINSGPSLNLNKISFENSFGVSFGFMSYGKFRSSPDFNLLQFGVNYQSISQQASINLIPASINVGYAIGTNFVSNTYLGPSMEVNSNKEYNVGMNVTLSF